MRKSLDFKFGALVLFLSALCLLLNPLIGNAASDMPKTKTVKVGDKAPGMGELKQPFPKGKPLVLVMFPTPLGCGGCDTLEAAMSMESKKHPEISFVIKGGDDIRGTMDPDTVILKKAYGFVTMGEAWTIYIDANGIIQKMTLGRFAGSELESYLEELQWIK
ncbi:MAG: hypothetical protein HY280_05160 [Nitrospinae bacterium]|nr:hypothetical protein [Nitrospinota bacterium]